MVTPDDSLDGPAESAPAQPMQQELTLAIVDGTALTEFPQDLYIPPDAMRVFLETFEGPLDLLLYLIQRQNLNILDIPITEITLQYLQYIELMQELQLDLAAEYLVMAALLLEIKSRLLLPRNQEEEAVLEEDDPRRRLVQQLQEYARIKQAAQELSDLPQMGRDTFPVDVDMPDIPKVRVPPKVPLAEVLEALRQVLVRMELFTAHHISREPLSVRERMSYVLERLSGEARLLYHTLFRAEEGRAGAVVAFLAILELGKESLLQLSQEQPFGPIEVRPPREEDGA